MKQVVLVFQWIFSLVFLTLAVQNILSISRGQSDYSDLIVFLGAAAFGCMLFPPLQSYIQKNPFHKQIKWGIGVLFVLWLVLSFLGLDSFAENNEANKKELATFEAVHQAAQKYCDGKGECADSINDLLSEGYLPMPTKPVAGQRPKDDDPYYSSIGYYSTGNNTGCTITVHTSTSFGQTENLVKYCAVK